MKKTLSTLAASTVLVTAAFAGPLNTHGIPADVIGVFHVDIEAAGKNPAAEALRKHFQNELENAKENDFAKKLAEYYKGLKDKAGFDPLSDISDITVGLLPPAKEPPQGTSKKNTSPKESSGTVLIIRGKFNFLEIQAYLDQKLRGKDSKTFTLGKHVFYREQDGIFSILNNKTVLYVTAESQKEPAITEEEARKAAAKAALAAFAGKTRSFVVPASLVTLGKQTDSPIAHFYLNAVPLNQGNIWDDVQVPGEIFLALGHADRTLKLRGIADYPDEKNAKKLLDLAKIAIDEQRESFEYQVGQYKKDPRDPTFGIAIEGAIMLSALKVTSAGKSFNLSLDHPATGLAKLIRDCDALAVQSAERGRAQAAEYEAKKKAQAEAKATGKATGN